MFAMPEEESDLPSTPPRSERSLFAPKSTTPGHDPPSYLTNISTTPLGPPPRSIYGSSAFQPGTTFSKPRGTPLKGFSLPQSSPPHQDGRSGARRGNVDDSYMSRGMGESRSALMSSMRNSMRGSKRRKIQPRKESAMPGIARGMSKQAGMAKLREGDDLVLDSEEVISSLDAKAQNHSLDELDNTLAAGAAQLSRLWSHNARPSTKDGTVGPASNDPIARCNYVSSLLLQMHHPHSAKPVQPAPSRFRGTSAAGQRTTSHAISLPRALLDWLNAHHNPFPDDFDMVHLYEPAPSNNDSFWDVVYASTLRGRFERTIRLLKDAGWEYAITALDDGGDEAGYHGSQLQNTQAVTARCAEILGMCPAYTSDDWDVKGPNWSLFRQRIRQAISELEDFAEGDGQDRERGAENVFAQSGRSGFQDSMSLSTASRRAESKVPWTVYESLKALYGQLLGSTDEIVLVAQDWLEGSIYMAVWWDGEDEAELPASLAKSGLRRSMAGSQRTRESDVTPLVAYRNRLAGAHALVTDDPEEPVFQVDTMDPVQVAISCAMEDNVESAIAMLCTWSMSAAAATVEIAGLGGWLPQGRPRSRGLADQGFNSEDLMVLSHGPAAKKPADAYDRDEVLSHYADLLANRETFKRSDGNFEKEGWELAVAVLGRMDDTSTAQRKVGDLLETLELVDDARVDSVLTLCRELGLVEQARTISERYADTLASTKTSYGQALTFYARAHATAKIQSTLSLLTSASLITSSAYPSTPDLDEPFAALLSKSRTGLVRLARCDPEAAALLSSNLSGYATLRKFYDLRDQDVTGAGGLRRLERKRVASAALMAVIESASDPIRGGLFDPSVESPVSTDALLALLGESLPLLGSEKRVFTKQQVFALLRVVEDFATAPLRIRQRAGDLLHASSGAYRGAASGKDMADLLKDSRSDPGAGEGGSYDMLAQSVVALSQSQAGGKDKAGGEVRRAWDWRKGLDGIGGASAGEAEVLGVLRTALAGEVARGWGGSGW